MTISQAGSGFAFRRRSLAVLGMLALLVISACSAEEREATSLRQEDRGAESIDGSRQDVPVAAVNASLSHRIGSGRAIAAASEGPTTVIATTIGVSVARNGDVLPMLETPTAPARSVGVSPDGNHAIISWPDRTETWTLNGTPSAASILPAAIDYFLTADGRALLISETEVYDVDLAANTQTEFGAGEGEVFFAATADPNGAWWLAPTFKEGGRRS